MLFISIADELNSLRIPWAVRSRECSGTADQTQKDDEPWNGHLLLLHSSSP
jgi:hypothetical protein